MIKNTNTTTDMLGQDDVLIMGAALGGQELHSLSDFVTVLEQYPPNLNDRVLMIKDFLAKVFDIRKLPTDEYERFQRLGMKESYTVSSTEINGDYINNQIVNNNVYGEGHRDRFCDTVYFSVPSPFHLRTIFVPSPFLLRCINRFTSSLSKLCGCQCRCG